MRANQIIILAIVCLVAGLPVRAQNNEALRGKMAMSVYVSVYGDSEFDAAAFRLSIEQQLHDMGITVLPHGDPPDFPVLNLSINVTQGTQTTTTVWSSGRVTSVDTPLSGYSSRIELRQLAPGRTAAMRPIEDVAIWSRTTDPQVVAATASWKIPGEALDLTMQFVQAWQAINGANHPPTPDKPMPLANLSAAPAASEPGQSLYTDGSCPTRAGGGCVDTISQAVTDSFNGVPNALEDVVRQQLADLVKSGQKVITCTYGPSNVQARTGYVTFNYWYQAAPPDILKMLVSAFPHPFMPLGRVAVSGCPTSKAAANVVFASRFN